MWKVRWWRAFEGASGGAGCLLSGVLFWPGLRWPWARESVRSVGSSGGASLMIGIEHELPDLPA